MIGVNYTEVADYLRLQLSCNPEANNDSPQQLSTPKMVLNWTDEEPNFMLATYRASMHKVGSLKQFKN